MTATMTAGPTTAGTAESDTTAEPTAGGGPGSAPPAETVTAVPGAGSDTGPAGGEQGPPATTAGGKDGLDASDGPAVWEVWEDFAAAQEAACDELAGLVGRSASCAHTGLPRATWYRHHRASPAPSRAALVPHTDRVQPRALEAAERDHVHGLLNSERFIDTAPATVYATLLDEGVYHCSISTMYRILRAHDEVHERRRQATHPPRVKPELVASCPNCVWSWDITKLAGPAKGIYYHAYVLIDIYSRYTPGWMVAEREDADLARRFLSASLAKHNIDPDTLTLHADRGTSMKSKSVAELLSDLHVTRSHSRPKTSNDNPYSEAQFKTMKYRPVFPDRFDSIEHARTFLGDFFDWYNHQHRHSGIGLHTPHDVHYGLADTVREGRAHVLTGAYQTHPERFVHGTPEPPRIPDTAWINRPTTEQESTTITK